ncbi:DNA-3-methyladenine glycosylase [Fluoribacter dumoffii]|uniref:DNA-3-methyladenine glycosylase family protein n=1 Tax=Fluoribacter dumoffii TaxID=463 RepID=UPI00026C7EE5|nr:DNA-3-methyladenine glycosylase [Fluoribacter dumoffii]MCW8417807.1 DNA-3-methyladenine glycosylase [Fluoribacter dumoffii]MCW8454351.1 DNA-3-methyladenine glycosylase [Fluoribacter dumoffii]MCW8461575.1 DNA-3-methyladenine glycosylase [Fluoribacter dumoffii]MCW8481791.1 DNA-3-methyladenine glycosylase [Fluoribacter dumoffii]
MDYRFTLNAVAPFRLDYTVFALRRRSKNKVDLWDRNCYTRVLIIENTPVKVVVEQKKGINDPELLLHSEGSKQVSQNQIHAEMEKMLGLKRDLHDFYCLAEQDARLHPLALRFKGLKPPRFPSVFEALVNAVSCQQISLDAGLQIQNRLVEYLGLKIKGKEEKVFYAFPRPTEVANCSVSELKNIGYSTHKSETLIRLASAFIGEEAYFGSLENKSNEEIINFLCAFKGVGRWTAEYVLLRGLGRIDIFPGDDIGAQNNLYQLLHLERKPDYKKIAEITAKWHPYAGFVYFHLLLQRLHEKQALT